MLKILLYCLFFLISLSSIGSSKKSCSEILNDLPYQSIDRENVVIKRVADKSYLAISYSSYKDHILLVNFSSSFTSEQKDYFLKVLRELIGVLPKNHYNKIDEINILDKKSFDTKGESSIDIFNPSRTILIFYSTISGENNLNTNYRESLFFHEFAHALSIKVFGKYIPKGYDEAIFKDGNFVSSHSKRRAAEDFADSVALYLVTRGGIDDQTIDYSELNNKLFTSFYLDEKMGRKISTKGVRNLFKHRYEFIDKLFVEQEYIKSSFSAKIRKVTYHSIPLYLMVGVPLFLFVIVGG